MVHVALKILCTIAFICVIMFQKSGLYKLKLKITIMIVNPFFSDIKTNALENIEKCVLACIVVTRLKFPLDTMKLVPT